jgi:hypothetical protein
VGPDCAPITTLARSADAPANFGLVNPSLGNLIWDAAPVLNWLAAPNQFPEVGTKIHSFAETPDQETIDQPEASHLAAVDKAFADLANERDNFGDLGDY